MLLLTELNHLVRNDGEDGGGEVKHGNHSCTATPLLCPFFFRVLTDLF